MRNPLHLLLGLLLSWGTASGLSAQAPFHGTVEVIQNDAGNLPSSVTLSLSLGSSPDATILHELSNRGDYTLRFPPGNDVTSGVLLSSVAENGRDNSAGGDPPGTFYGTSAIDVWGPDYYISIFRSPPPTHTEANINASFAYFPFSGWLAGHARNAVANGPITTLNASPGIHLGAGQQFVDNGDGTYDLDLRGLGAHSDEGILLVSGGKDVPIFALSRANAKGTFTIFCHSNAVDGPNYVRDPVAFAYIPTNRVGSDGLVAMGRVLSGPGTGNAPVEAGAGPFVVSRTGTGTWTLQLNTFGAENGTLLVSPEGGDSFNVDNAISAEYMGNGIWEIQSRDLPNYNLQNGSSPTEPMFSFAYFINHSFVRADAPGDGTGLNWNRAYTSLQTALERAIPGQSIWVAEGTYYPDEFREPFGSTVVTGDRTDTFDLRPDVALYGGFPATGNPTWADRDHAVHETILSGDIDQNDGPAFANTGGNSFHVLNAAGATIQNAVLDGFTVTAGNANGASFDARGGGLLMRFGAEVAIRNCRFRANQATFGGAVASQDSAPTFTDCIFEGNQASTAGALWVDMSPATVENSIFRGNEAFNNGGAVVNSSAPTIFWNSLFVGNHASEGSAIFNQSAAAEMINCTIQGNRSMVEGGAIFNLDSSPVLRNTIVWNNAEVDFLTMTHYASLYNLGDSNPTAIHSLIHNWTTNMLSGTGNLDGTDPANDPRFFAEIDPLDTPVATGGDWRLQASTPLLDRGTFIAGGPPTDLAGRPRFLNAAVELGAYEVSAHFVNVGRTGGEEDGSTWFNAFLQLQEALQAAQAGDFIYVAEGTYYPDRFASGATGDRMDTFALQSGAEIYGGFPNTDPAVNPPAWADRNPAAYETILSGDIDQNDGPDFANTESNAYHVVTANGVTDAVLDGVVITAGNANGVPPLHQGGGMNMIGSHGVAIRNCVYRRNQANGGGAVFSWNSSPSFTACVFEENYAEFGGALDSLATSAAVTNTLFRNNEVADSGGAVFEFFSSSQFVNSAFVGNKANQGGAITNEESPTRLINCTFQGNRAASIGGAINNVSTSPELVNCIVWNNAEGSSTTIPTASIFNGGTSDPAISHSLIQNWTAADLGGAGNLDGTDPFNNPRFVAEIDPMAAPTLGADLRLFIHSPALDAGDNSANTTETDLAGNPRIQNGTVDLGAIEGFVDDPQLLWDTDFDFDGHPYALELISGTDPEIPDQGSLYSLSVITGAPGLTFFRMPDTPFDYILRVMRATDLIHGPFVEIFRITRDGSGTDTEGGNLFMLEGPHGELVTFLDMNTSHEHAFYHLEAEFVE